MSGEVRARVEQAKRCLHRGYLDLTTADGRDFPTVGHCVIYALAGGELKDRVTAPPLGIQQFDFVTNDISTCSYTFHVEFTGGTGVLRYEYFSMTVEGSGDVTAYPGYPAYLPWTFIVTAPDGSSVSQTANVDPYLGCGAPGSR